MKMLHTVTMTVAEVKELICGKYNIRGDWTLNIEDSNGKIVFEENAPVVDNDQRFNLDALMLRLKREDVFVSEQTLIVRPEKKIHAIKAIREFYLKVGEQHLGLGAAKTIAENFPLFVGLCKHAGKLPKANDFND